MGLKERLGLTETVYVGVGMDRKKMRPAPGTMIIELVSPQGSTVAVDTVKVPNPAPRGPYKPTPRIAATHVIDGETSLEHQAFRYRLDEDVPIDLPAHLREKADLGAEYVNIWWSCET